MKLEKLDRRVLLAADLGIIDEGLRGGFFSELQNSVNSSVLSTPAPFVGDALAGEIQDGSGGSNQFLRDWGQELDTLSIDSGASVDNVLTELANALNVPQEEISVTGSDGDSNIRFDLTLTDSISVDAAVDLDLVGADPELELLLGTDDAVDLQIDLEYQLAFEVRENVNGTSEFFVDTGLDDPELSISYQATLRDDFDSGKGRLGVFIADFSTSQNPEFNSAYTGTYTLDVFQNASGSPAVNGSLTGSGAAHLDVDASFFPGTTDSSDLINLGVTATGTVDYATNLEFESDSVISSENVVIVSIDDVALDLGRLYSDFVDPLIRRLQGSLKPTQPVIDFLTGPLPVISDLYEMAGQGEVNALDLADVPDTVRTVVNVMDAILSYDGLPGGAGFESIFSLEIPKTGFAPDNDSSGNASNSQSRLDNGDVKLELADRFKGDVDENASEQEKDAARKKARDDFKKAQPWGSDFGAAFDLPFLSDFDVLAGMVLGDTSSDLMKFGLTLDKTIEADVSVPIAPLLNLVQLNAGIEATLEINLAGGYDVYGINQLSQQADFSSVENLNQSIAENRQWLINGFYLDDRNQNKEKVGVAENIAGQDLPEVYFKVEVSGGISGGLSLGVARATVGGDLFMESDIEFDLNDLPESDDQGLWINPITPVWTPAQLEDTSEWLYDGRIRVPELRTIARVNPLAVVNINGKLEAGLEAGVKIKGPFGITLVDKSWELLRVTLVEGKLFEFDDQKLIKEATSFDVAEVVNGELRLYAGDTANLRADNNTQERDEKFTIRSAGESEEGLGETLQVIFEDSAGKQYFNTFQNVTSIDASTGDGNDYIHVQETAVDVIVRGGEGNDTIIVESSGEVTLYGDGGDDQIIGGLGGDIIYGGAGNDQLVGGEGGDTIYGGAGNDQLVGGEGGDTIHGGAGNDFIDGSQGDDNLYGDDGEDQIYGGVGVDTIYGGADNDDLDGGADNDTVRGESGDDVLNGGQGADDIDGGLDNDTIQVGFFLDDADVMDTLRGGDGEDRFEVFGSSQDDTFTIQALGGPDSGEFEVSHEFSYQDDNGQTEDTTSNFKIHLPGVVSERDIEEIRFSGFAGDDTITVNGDFGSASTVMLRGGEGNDVIKGSSGTDTIIGGLGDDVIDGREGDDVIYGGEDPDQINGQQVVYSTDADQINGGAGGDKIFGGFGDDIIEGGADRDTLEGNEGNDTIYGFLKDLAQTDLSGDTLKGDDGNDTLYGGADDDDIFGGAGNDTLDGRGHDDSLFGEAGDDIIAGGTGRDTIWGGAGNDQLFALHNPGQPLSVLTPDELNAEIEQINAANTLASAVSSVNSILSQLSLSSESNLARDGVASQSSTTHGGVPERAIDGNTDGDWRNGSVTHTADQSVSYWEVDLAQESRINRVVVWNRTHSGAAARLTRFSVVLLDAAGQEVTRQEITNMPAPSEAVNFGGSVGKTIRIEKTDSADNPDGVLSLAEVQVFGTPAMPTSQGVPNYKADLESALQNLKSRVGAEETVAAAEFVTSVLQDLNPTNAGSIDTLLGGEGDDRLVGTDDIDILFGGSGDDEIEGGGGADRIQFDLNQFDASNILLNDDVDQFIGGTDSNVFEILGTHEADIIELKSNSDDTLTLFRNDEAFRFDSPLSLGFSGIRIDGLKGDDIITATGQVWRLTIDGGEGNDKISGSDASDLLRGGAGADAIYGNGGNDVIYATSGERPQPTLTDGFGLVAAPSNEDVLFKLEMIDESPTDQENVSIIKDRLFGGDGDDVLIGSDGNDVIHGDGGNDILVHTLGDDVIDGGEGRDRYTYVFSDSAEEINLQLNSQGVAIHHVELGVDTAAQDATTFDKGSKQIEVLAIEAGDGNDRINVDFGVNAYMEVLLDGGLGNDTIDLINAPMAVTVMAGTGDHLKAYTGESAVKLILEGNVLTGRNAYTIEGIQELSKLSLTGDDRDNELNADSFLGELHLDGKAGDDHLLVGAGGGSAHGGSGVDTIKASGDVDFEFRSNRLTRTSGEVVNTTELSGFEKAILTGGDSDNVIDGNAFGLEFLEIHGGFGDDHIIGSSGDDKIFGGAGNDRIWGFAGTDEIRGEAGDDEIYADWEVDDVLVNLANAVLVELENRQDEIHNTIFGGDGNDVIHGGHFRDLIWGDNGNDSLYGGGHDDDIDGGVGNDFMYGGLGNDSIRGRDGNDVIEGNEGDDSLKGSKGDDILFGGDGNDKLYGHEDNDTLYGGDGNDELYGHDGNDHLYGEAGDDILQGGRDGTEDRLDGGSGHDRAWQYFYRYGFFLQLKRHQETLIDIELESRVEGRW